MLSRTTSVCLRDGGDCNGFRYTAGGNHEGMDWMAGTSVFSDAELVDTMQWDGWLDKKSEAPSTKNVNRSK